MTSIDDITWPVTTERLSFRPAEKSDAAAFHAYRRLPDVSDWLPRISPDEAAVAQRFEDDDFRRRTLMIEVDGQVAGDGCQGSRRTGDHPERWSIFTVRARARTCAPSGCRRPSTTAGPATGFRPGAASPRRGRPAPTTARG